MSPPFLTFVQHINLMTMTDDGDDNDHRRRWKRQRTNNDGTAIETFQSKDDIIEGAGGAENDERSMLRLFDGESFVDRQSKKRRNVEYVDERDWPSWKKNKTEIMERILSEQEMNHRAMTFRLEFYQLTIWEVCKRMGWQ